MNVMYPKVGPVAKFFVEAAKQIPEVQLVLLQDGDGDDCRIWTIIDATPFDEAPRRAVYEREFEARKRSRGGLWPLNDN